jgi:HD-like signal output (HDOD) protein
LAGFRHPDLLVLPMIAPPGSLSAAHELPSEIAAIANRRLGHLCVLPAVATRALEIAKDPDSSIAVFASVVEQDIVLAADILRVANSAVYGFRSQVTDLHQAVFRVGFRQCKNLILASCMTGMLRQVSVNEEWIRELLWRHGITTAVAAVHLNRVFDFGFFGEEFTAGLIHDLGRILMASILPDQFLAADPLDFVELQTSEDEHPLAAETTIIGTTHVCLGAWYLAKIGLPSELIDVVRYHHQPCQAVQHPNLVALIAAADHMANFLQRESPLVEYDPHDNFGIRQLAEGTRESIVEDFGNMAPVLLEQISGDSREICL